MLSLSVTHPTIFKYAPLPSSDMDKGLKFQSPVDAGIKVPLKSWNRDRNSHLRLKLASPLNGYDDWYIYEGHAKVEGTPERKKSVKLKVKYKSQLDNEHNPTGSCNVTSVATCAEYEGILGNGDGQLEDQMYRNMEDWGLSRHNPQDLAILAARYKLHDDFTEFGTIERCQEHLSMGSLCIIHGWFSRSGHIIVLVGYDEDGFLVHDPYGEWHRGGYDTSVSGAYLHYSYDMIREFCIPDGQFWVHYIG
jgi:hypothetical protein